MSIRFFNHCRNDENISSEQNPPPTEQFAGGYQRTVRGGYHRPVGGGTTALSGVPNICVHVMSAHRPLAK